MFRYLALLWNPSDSDQDRHAATLCARIRQGKRGLQRYLSRDGCCVYGDESLGGGYDVRVLPPAAGAVLGMLFRRTGTVNDEGPMPRAILREADSQVIIRSRGRRLITDYWGDYVAVLPDPDRPNVTHLVKDPTGSLPCYVTVWREVHVVFSSLEDCEDLNAIRFPVNWSFVEHRIAGIAHDTGTNSLRDVTQVLRGQCLTVSLSRSTHHSAVFYWNPAAFTEIARAIDDRDLARRALRATIRSVIHSLACQHSSILLRLSGGLDSSIVASCLADSPAACAVIAYTYFASGGRSDERRWARISARHVGFQSHVERPIDVSAIPLNAMEGVRPLVAPGAAIGRLIGRCDEINTAREHGSTAIFSGDGGDAVFGSEAVGVSVDDYLAHRGIRAGLIPLAAQVALCRDRLFWSVVAGALTRWWRGSRIGDFSEQLTARAVLCSDDVRNAALRSASLLHPWFQDCHRVPWTTIWRVGRLTHRPEFYDPFSDPREHYPVVVAPLLAQPVVELALRIPTDIHFLHGHDRGLAREAFACELPDSIRQRRWKDRAPGFFEAVVSVNRRFIRETLLGGRLAERGMLHKTKLERALCGEATDSRYFAGEFVSLLEMEMWLRHFDSGLMPDLPRGAGL